MTRIRLSPYLERFRDQLEGQLRAQPEIEATAKELSAFFAGMAMTAPATEDAASADARALRLRNSQLRAQLSEAIRSGFVGALRAIRPPVAPDPPRPGDADGGPGGAGQGDDGPRSVLSGLHRSLFGRSDLPAEEVAPTPQAPIEVNVTLLLASLAGSLEAADQVLAAAEPLPAERVPIPWTEDLELMELFQDLLRALTTNDEKLGLRHIARLRRWLPERHGVEVIEAWNDNEDHFRVLSTRDPGILGPVTLRPALVRADTGAVVLRGEVILPAGPAALIPPTFSDATGAEAEHE